MLLCQQCSNIRKCETHKQIQDLNSKTVQIKKIDCKNYKSEWNEFVDSLEVNMSEMRENIEFHKVEDYLFDILNT